MDEKEIWQTVLGELEVTLSKANFTTWFKDTFILTVGEEEVVVAVPNGFAKMWLENKFNPAILTALQKNLPKVKSIKYQISTNIAPRVTPPINKSEDEETPAAKHLQLNSK